MALLFDRWAKAGIVVGVFVAGAGGAFLVKARSTSAPSASTTIASPASNATMEEQNVEGCKPPETGAEQAARVMPVVATKMALSESEQRDAAAIMAARLDGVRALQKDRREGSKEAATRAGLELDKQTRTKIEALLGGERGREFYRTYFRSDDKLFASKDEAEHAQATRR